MLAIGMFEVGMFEVGMFEVDMIEEVRVHFEKHRDFLEKMKEIEDNKKNENQDADEENEEDYVQIDDETTTAEEMKDFEKFAQRQAQNQVRKYNQGKKKK